MPDFYILDVNSSGVIARIGINDAPLATDSQASGLSQVQQVNEWIMPGENRLTVFLLRASHQSPAAAKAQVRASVYINQPESPTPAPATVLATFQWPLPSAPELYPFKMEVPFTVPQPPASSLWREAEELRELTDADKASILSLIESLRSSLVPLADASVPAKLTQYKTDDVARANGGDIERARAMTRRQFGIFARLDRPVSSPIAPVEAIFEIVAQKKLVYVSTVRSGEAINVTEADGGVFSISVYVARIAGQWTIVR